MEDKLITKTIRMPESLVNLINKMGKEKERDFSAQVRFIIKEYIRITENK